MDGVPLPVPLMLVVPGAVHTQHIEHTVQKAPIIVAGAVPRPRADGSSPSITAHSASIRSLCLLPPLPQRAVLNQAMTSVGAPFSTVPSISLKPFKNLRILCA